MKVVGGKKIVRALEKFSLLIFTMVIIAALFQTSLTKASGPSVAHKPTPIPPTDVMRGLITKDTSGELKCLISADPPTMRPCRGFVNTVDEAALRNLVQNYPNCLDGPLYSLNFGTQPEIVINKTLVIYGRTDKPFIIRGLRLVAGRDFPPEGPAVAIYGKEVILENIYLEGFNSGIFLGSSDGIPHKIIGGEFISGEVGNSAITSCFDTPIVEDIETSGFKETVSIISGSL